MLESPFTFPDGDHHPINLTETPGGGVKLSDRGHSLMHVSYEHDGDSFHEGATASLRGQIVRESGIDEEDGISRWMRRRTRWRPRCSGSVRR